MSIKNANPKERNHAADQQRMCKINWISHKLLRLHDPQYLYDMEMMVRPNFGADRTPRTLSSAPATCKIGNMFMVPEPWLDESWLSTSQTMHKGWPAKSRKKWWQARLVLVKRHNVGIGWIETDDKPVDMYALSPGIHVHACDYWNKKMAHTYTAAWPMEVS